MSLWHLFWIIPLCVCVGVCIMALFVAAKE